MSTIKARVVPGIETVIATEDGRLWLQLDGTLSNGYLRTATRDSRGIKRQFAMHRLVAQAWISNPDALPEVDHINGNRADNRVENLRWVTKAENLRAMHARVDFKGAKGSNARFTAEQVVEFCRRVLAGETQTAVAASAGMHIANLRKILHRVSWVEATEGLAAKLAAFREQDQRRYTGGNACHPTPQGQANGMAKLDEAKVREMRQRRRNGETLKQLAAAFGVTFGLVSQICSGKVWKHVADETPSEAPSA